MKTEVINEGLKAAPPVTVAVVANVHSWNMADWVTLGTGIYVALQAAYLLWRWYRDITSSK